jgi:hypothetical protein
MLRAEPTQAWETCTSWTLVTEKRKGERNPKEGDPCRWTGAGGKRMNSEEEEKLRRG